MDHSHIVQASDLSRFADIRGSQAVIPELVYFLIRGSVPNATNCRIPYGDAINQPGRDGIVECDGGYFHFVPGGTSYWEIGTGGEPQNKATTDFRKRTEELSETERAESSFVFVTPRSSGANGWNEPNQAAWMKRCKNKGWNRICIIDGVKLADWLREFPAIGLWMATKVGITASLGDMITPRNHWDLICSQEEKGDPPLPPALFTTSRDGACVALEAIFAGKSKRRIFFSESEHDVDDFVAAYLMTLDEAKAQEYTNRCLFIKDENAWRTVCELRQPHVLVAHPRLGLDSEKQDLQTVATQRGHRVIIPLCEASSGADPDIIKLRSPSGSQIEAVLKEAKFPEVRARELGRIGDGRISALRRHILGLGSVPPYATWVTARQLAQAGLVGKWNAKTSDDVQSMEALLGKGYGEWIEILRPDTLRSDSPLIQHDEKWRIVARGEAWNSLGSQITDDDLDKFQEMAVTVLGEYDPKFDISKENRYAASIHGKILTHSSLIRNGIAETLALLGSRPAVLSSCSEGKAECVVVLVIRRLLKEANWDCWASLDPIMPLLAEAAPDEFLDAVESVLVNIDNAPFHKIFAEEGGGGMGGWNYMSGLLWALEALAWSPEFLSRVSVILADIASIDPGGNWVNRPSNTLANIFLPWCVQTAAPFEKRRSAVEAVLREQPEVGWNLLLALSPHNHGSTTGCHRPVWRDFIPRDWKNGVLKTVYWEQIASYTDLAVDLAKSDSKKLCELIKRLSDLPKKAHESLLEYLTTDEIVKLPEADRLPLWENLDELVRRHRNFSDAGWALSEDAVNKIEKTAQALALKSPEFKYHYLFSGKDFHLFDKKGNYAEQQQCIDETRQAAIAEILSDGGVDAVLEFAAKVDSPYEVGRAFGAIASSEIEVAVLPSLLDSEDDTLVRVAASFIGARFWKLKIKWVDAALERDWSPEHRAKILTFLPFEEEIWKRVESHLKDAHEALYWKNVNVNPYGPSRDLTIAVENLLEFGREGAAVMCAARMADDKSKFDESLATRALLAALESECEIQGLDNEQVVELIKRLQESETSDKNALFRIEWNFLPWLGKFSSGSPITLEKKLASDPSFFAEVIRLVFRSENSIEEDSKEPDEQKGRIAINAYKLLGEWECCPGTEDDGAFNAEAFNVWLDEARRITKESGHAGVAQIQIGHILTFAPKDPDGLWIHKTVATVLNRRDTGKMRFGFTEQLFNGRGVHGFTNGQEERELASENREKAEALDSNSFTRFATEMREFANQYDRQAEHEATHNPYEDYD